MNAKQIHTAAGFEWEQALLLAARSAIMCKTDVTLLLPLGGISQRRGGTP